MRVAGSSPVTIIEGYIACQTHKDVPPKQGLKLQKPLYWLSHQCHVAQLADREAPARWTCPARAGQGVAGGV